MPINVGDLLVARYDWAFVAGSYVISVLGSFAAHHHTPFLFFRSGKINWNMALGAAVSLGGIGIWAMHFIGMMGYRNGLKSQCVNQRCSIACFRSAARLGQTRPAWSCPPPRS